jgi:hypothetical protein
MSGTGFHGKSHCQRGHDLTLPDAIGFDGNSSKRFCRLCRNMRKMASINRMRLKARSCRRCMTALKPGQKSSFCSIGCENQHRKINVEDAAAEAARADRLLALDRLLFRLPCRREREDIKRLIEQERARK